MIGLKYSAMGFVVFACSAYFLVRIMNESISAGFGVGGWIVMIMLCSDEAYKQGQKESGSPD